MKFNKSVIKDIKNARGERVITFFDAVLAIAITLLVLEMPVVDLRSTDQLWQLFTPFTAFAISFVVLGEIWIMHVRTFSLPTFKEHSSARLNMGLLFLIALFPKTTEMIATYPHARWGMVMYLGCVMLMAVLEILMIRGTFKDVYRCACLDAEKVEGVDSEAIQRRIEEMRVHPTDDLKKMYQLLNHQLHMEERTSVVSFVTIAGAVIFIFINPLLCWVCIVANVVINFILRYFMDDDKNDRAMAELNEELEKMEEDATAGE